LLLKQATPAVPRRRNRSVCAYDDRQLRPKTLIDLKAIEGIEGIEHQNGEGLSIGAASPLNMLVRNKFIRSEYGLLAQAAHSVGSLQVRNRASIGGTYAMLLRQLILPCAISIRS